MIDRQPRGYCIILMLAIFLAHLLCILMAKYLSHRGVMPINLLMFVKHSDTIPTSTIEKSWKKLIILFEKQGLNPVNPVNPVNEVWGHTLTNKEKKSVFSEYRSILCTE